MVASLAFWLTTGLLAGGLLAGAAGLFFLMATGRLTLDLGWGRSRHSLGPITQRIDAPRELVFEVAAAPYLGRTPPAGTEVWERGSDLVVAAHHTRVHFYTARTVEAVRFEEPERIAFRHLQGPVPEAFEEFLLRDAGGGTELEYRGQIGIDWWLLGRLAGRVWVVPQWESKVRPHLEDLKERAEERARRRRGREERD